MQKNFDDLPMMLTVDELAKVLRIGRNAAYQMVKDGLIRSIRVGRTRRTIRIPRDAIIQFTGGI